MKTIFITGSTDGIGKLAAVKLAQDGHQLILHGRNAGKLDATLAEIKKAAPNAEPRGYLADFSDLDAVRSLGKKLNEEVEKIDVLINNAGVYKSAQQKNSTGFDLRLVVNYYAPYVLTTALLPLLDKSHEPNIINLSSAAQSSVDQSFLDGSSELSTHEAYGQSKLAILIWSFHLAANRPKISVVALNPGSLLDTKMVREGFGQIWSSADKGADIICRLATTSNPKEDSGKYFDNDKGDFGRAHGDAYDTAKINELIQWTNQIISA